MSGSAADVGGIAPAADLVPTLRVLVAPDCYGDSLTAVEAAAAIATGWNRGRPAGRKRAGRVGAGPQLGDGIPGMRAGVRIGPPRWPADAANGAVRAQQG